MKRTAFALTLLLLLLASGCVEEQGEQSIKIGVIEALTGDGAQYGEWVREGLTIAADEINEGGGINGRKVELVFEDHKAKPQEAVSAYQKLRFENVSIVLMGWSSPSVAVSPLANRDKVILFTYSATTPLYSTKDDFTFRTAVTAKQYAKEEAEFLFERLGKKKVAALYTNNDFGLGMKNVFVETFEGLGGEVLIVEAFEQESKDFRSLITKVKASDPEAIFLVGQLVENGMLVKQMNEADFDRQIVADVYSVEGSDFLQGAGNAAEGIIYVAPFFEENKKPGFAARYREKFGESPNYMGAQAYDAVMIVAKALQVCPSEFDTECIKDELFKIKGFEGASGILTFDEFGDVEKPVMFKTIKNGEFVSYEVPA